jgi:hypothetical protein
VTRIRASWSALKEHSPVAAAILVGGVGVPAVILAVTLIEATGLWQALDDMAPSSDPPTMALLLRLMLRGAVMGAVAGGTFVALFRRLGGRAQRGAGPVSAACAGAASFAAGFAFPIGRHRASISWIDFIFGAVAGLFYYWLFEWYRRSRRDRALARFRSIRR